MSYHRPVTGTRLYISSNENASSNHSAPARIDGGMSVKKDLYIGGDLYIDNCKLDLSTVTSKLNKDLIPNEENLNIGSVTKQWNSVYCTSLQNKLFITTQDLFLDIDKAFKSIAAAISCEQTDIFNRHDLLDELSANDRKAIYIEMDHITWQCLDDDTNIEIQSDESSWNGHHKVRSIGPGYLIFKLDDMPLKSNIDDDFLVPEIGKVRIIDKMSVRLDTDSTPLVLNNNLTIETKSSTFQQEVHFSENINLLKNLNLHNANNIQFHNSSRKGEFGWNDDGFYFSDRITFHQSIRIFCVNAAITNLELNSMIVELHLNADSRGELVVSDNIRPGHVVRYVVTEQIDQHSYTLCIDNMLYGSGINFSKLGQTVELLYTCEHKWVYISGSERQYDICHD